LMNLAIDESHDLGISKFRILVITRAKINREIPPK